MILHTVNKGPRTHTALNLCLEFIAPDDALLLLEDGVYAACRSDTEADWAGTGRVFAIRADVDARGLTNRLDDRVEIIDYDEFVSLCCDYPVIKNWS